MILGDLEGLKSPDIGLTGEEKARKNFTQETCPDRGSNPGLQRDKRACYHLLHSGGLVQNQNIVIENVSFEKVEKFKYLGVTVTNTNDIREEIKRRINMGNACYYSVEKILWSCLLFKKLKVNTYKTIILPVVLYVCETWPLTLSEKHRLRVFENKVLRKIFGVKRDDITGECGKLHNAQLHALYSSPNIIRNLKSRRLRWAGYVARMEQSRNAYRVLEGKPEEKRSLRRPRRTVDWRIILKWI